MEISINDLNIFVLLFAQEYVINIKISVTDSGTPYIYLLRNFEIHDISEMHKDAFLFFHGYLH